MHRQRCDGAYPTEIRRFIGDLTPEADGALDSKDEHLTERTLDKGSGITSKDGKTKSTRYPNLSVVTLPELRGITHQQVVVWSRSKHVRAICNIPEKAIDSLFKRQDLCKPDGSISMQSVADELEKLVGYIPPLRNEQMPSFLWWLVRLHRRRRMLLQKRQSMQQPRLEQLIVKGVAEQLFQGKAFRRTVQELRRHRRRGSHDLDEQVTIEATIRRGGLFLPFYGLRKTLPEYLALIERVSTRDQQARFEEELVHRLGPDALPRLPVDRRPGRV